MGILVTLAKISILDEFIVQYAEEDRQKHSLTDLVQAALGIGRFTTEETGGMTAAVNRSIKKMIQQGKIVCDIHPT